MELADLIAVWIIDYHGWIVQPGRKGRYLPDGSAEAPIDATISFWAPEEAIYWNLYRINDDNLTPIWPFTGVNDGDKPIVDTINGADPDFFQKLEQTMTIAKPTIDKLRDDHIRRTTKSLNYVDTVVPFSI